MNSVVITLNELLDELSKENKAMFLLSDHNITY